MAIQPTRSIKLVERKLELVQLYYKFKQNGE
jgi:hypothetical protein